MMETMNVELLVTFSVSFGFGAVVFAKAFVADWKNVLLTFGEMIESKSPKAETLKKLKEFFRSHSAVKQLSFCD